MTSTAMMRSIPAFSVNGNRFRRFLEKMRSIPAFSVNGNRFQTAPLRGSADLLRIPTPRVNGGAIDEE